MPPRVLSPRLILAPEPLVFPRTVTVDGEEVAVWTGLEAPERSQHGIIELRDWTRPHEQLLVAHWVGSASLAGKPAGLWVLYHLTETPFAADKLHDGIVDALVACGAIAKVWPLAPNAEGLVDLPDLDAEAAARVPEAEATVAAWPASWRKRLPTDKEAETVVQDGQIVEVKPADPPTGSRRLGVVIAGIDAAVKVALERPKQEEPKQEGPEPDGPPGTKLLGKAAKSSGGAAKAPAEPSVAPAAKKAPPASSAPSKAAEAPTEAKAAKSPAPTASKAKTRSKGK